LFCWAQPLWIIINPGKKGNFQIIYTVISSFTAGIPVPGLLIAQDLKP
jgi:hypothetical protein